MRYVWQSVRALVACLLVTIFAVPPGVVARSNVVSPADLQKEMVATTQARQHNLETVKQFLSSPRAENALKSAHMNPEQVRTAVSTLNDQELARLASRADKAQADFAGGRLEDRDLLIIISFCRSAGLTTWDCATRLGGTAKIVTRKQATNARTDCHT